MADPEWGVKRACPNCAARFYDLNADPTTCPNCESEFPLSAFSYGKPKAAPEKVEEVVAKKSPIDDIEDADVLDDDSDDVLDDDELLEDDDDETVSIDEIADVPANDDE